MMTMKKAHTTMGTDDIDWFEIELEEDQDLDYPFLPACDNIWTE